MVLLTLHKFLCLVSSYNEDCPFNLVTLYYIYNGDWRVSNFDIIYDYYQRAMSYFYPSYKLLSIPIVLELDVLPKPKQPSSGISSKSMHFLCLLPFEYSVEIELIYGESNQIKMQC